ncbi:MAG: GGDEF domain-containing protein, partial [Gluconacetobacter diazotrophicus]|nr:GGDEF domain-containing protein [Gluconacetobacter diazotrophicus]
MRMRYQPLPPDQKEELRRDALRALLRSWQALSVPALGLILLIECVRVPDRGWTHAPFVTLVLLHGLGCWFARWALRHLGHAQAPPRGSTAAAAACCAVAGWLWASAALVVPQFPSALPRCFLIPTLIYAGVLLAPNLPGALSYTILTTLVAVIGAAGFDDPPGTMRLLAASCGATACGIVLWRHAEFVRGFRDRSEIEQQNEIIGILLHDFEEQGSSWLWETDAEFRLVSPSAPLMAAVGCSEQMLQSLSLRRWIAAKERRMGGGSGFAVLARAVEDRSSFRNVRVRLRARDETHWLLLTGKPVHNRDGSFRGYRGVGTDVTTIERSERQLAWLARHDSLTRLPNRTHFHEAVGQSCDDTMVEGTPIALLCLDLDGFKEVNDTLGHPAGDTLLFQVAGRLQGCLRAGDIAGRLGGDEFALLMHGADQGSAKALAGRVLARIAEPFDIEGAAVSIGVSIGIMLSTEGGSAARTLFKGADKALYAAKQAGRGTMRVFTPVL